MNERTMAKSKGVFAKLLLDDKELGIATSGIESTIWRSFAVDAERRTRETGIILIAKAMRPTEAEIKRRFEICCKWFGVFRGDLKWSVQRCVDHLSDALRTELDGGQYEPPSTDKAVWKPSALQEGSS